MKFKEFIFILEFISGDFGLSVSVTDLLNKSDIIEGDSKYLAPELLDRKCDAKADIFRFSFVFEMMLYYLKTEILNCSRAD